jgi:hypothetical protein
MKWIGDVISLRTLTLQGQFTERKPARLELSSGPNVGQASCLPVSGASRPAPDGQDARLTGRQDACPTSRAHGAISERAVVRNRPGATHKLALFAP